MARANACHNVDTDYRKGTASSGYQRSTSGETTSNIFAYLKTLLTKFENVKEPNTKLGIVEASIKMVVVAAVVVIREVVMNGVAVVEAVVSDYESEGVARHDRQVQRQLSGS